MKKPKIDLGTRVTINNSPIFYRMHQAIKEGVGESGTIRAVEDDPTLGVVYTIVMDGPYEQELYFTEEHFDIMKGNDDGKN